MRVRACPNIPQETGSAWLSPSGRMALCVHRLSSHQAQGQWGELPRYLSGHNFLNSAVFTEN